MSTEYAVKMTLPEFMLAAGERGFKLEVHREGTDKPRFRLVDGSPLGYAYDPREETALDGSTWTLFTRYGLNDVSGLTVPLEAIHENSEAFYELFLKDLYEAHIRRWADMFFWQNAVEPGDVERFCDIILDVAKGYRDEKRNWAEAYERDPLPQVVAQCPACDWPWLGDQKPSDAP